MERAERPQVSRPASQAQALPPAEVELAAARPQQAAAALPPAAPEVPARQLTAEERAFMDALTRLFTTAQEFGLTLASLETDVSTLPPDVREVVEQGREVAKAVKHFQRIIKKRLEVV